MIEMFMASQLSHGSRRQEIWKCENFIKSLRSILQIVCKIHLEIPKIVKNIGKEKNLFCQKLFIN